MDKVDTCGSLSTKLGVLVDTEVKTEELSTKSSVLVDTAYGNEGLSMKLGCFVDGDTIRDMGYLVGCIFMVGNFY